VVDGDPDYRAGTTRKAVMLLFAAYGRPRGTLALEQAMGVPVGCGFGASAAAAISAVYAAASCMGVRAPKRELAYFAHAADILERTGLGTVSVTYDATGAGAITKAGAPGVSRFRKVRCPAGTRLVTASLAAFRKSDVLSSPRAVEKVTRLGDRALRRFEARPTLETLASEGEKFSEALGLMSEGAKELAALAKERGADHASQNMIGQAVHAITPASKADDVATALRESSWRPLVEVFEIGTRRAGLLGAAPATGTSKGSVSP
jgi:pantoate kinase